MEQSKQQRIRELTDRLNRCRYEYYNLNAPSLTDAEYDALFDELSTLEKGNRLQHDELAHADGRLLSRCQRLGENSASDSAAVVG